MSRSARALVALLAAAIVVPLMGTPAAAAEPAYVPIAGSGSTWSYNALDQWRRDVQLRSGIVINYSANGSSAGRTDFRNGSVDFAVSELPYGLTDNGVVDTPPIRGFAYVPIVAGGTAFAYNLTIDGKQVTNLRLSGETVAKIFTRQVVDWSDPQITADNGGRVLPSRPIVPVVRSDGAGSTYQLTSWLAARYPDLWDAWCERPSCGATSNYPVKPGIEAKSGSSGVTALVSQTYSEGAITYVENGYARNALLPVVKLLNTAGYYVAPTAASAAVALTQATIRPDLTADLSGVYTAADKRAYPLSSYSSMIVPTDDNAGRFTPAKGATLSDFVYYALCEGQQKADALGYSPLPGNLVRAGVAQVARIPGTTDKLSPDSLAGCHNPTIGPDGSNPLLDNAPDPPECDRAGSPLCGTGGGVIVTPTPAPTAVPLPTASPQPTTQPPPQPTPRPTAAPTPTVSPRPSPLPPLLPSLRDRALRFVALTLARVFGVGPALGRSASEQLAQVLAEIRQAYRHHS